MVMPRSRSMSIRSRYWARMARGSTTPVSCSIRSARVDLPWSMWAMMQKFRISSGDVNVLSANVLTGAVPRESGRGTWSMVPCVRGWSVQNRVPAVSEHGPVPRPAHGAVTQVHGAERLAKLAYSPDLDGLADPGEVVWAWVPFEDDPAVGKDRPLLVVGRTGRFLLALMLSSK